ncbi:MAG: hypothetical protein ACQESN_00275 [Thermotogota bacterium]
MGRKSNKLLIIISIFLLFFNMIYASNYDEAYNLYLSGLKAYRSGEYENAQNFLESALEKSPRIEDEIPEIKLYLGLSAFQNRDYELSLQFLNLFPNNALANESVRNIQEKLLTQDVDVGDLVIKNPTNGSTTTEKNNINTGSFLTITFIIFIISILSAFAVWFLLKKYSTVDFGKQTKKITTGETEDFEEPEEVIQPIILEEVINLKLDNLETIWQKSKALKRLLGEIDEDFSHEESDDMEEEDVKTNKLKKMIDDSMKDVDLDELENILDDYDSEEDETEETKDSTEEVEKIKNDDDSNTSEEDLEINEDEIEKDTQNLDQVSLEDVKNDWEESADTIKPDQNAKNTYNKIMNEKEAEIIREAESFNDLNSLIEDIEASNKDKGRKEYTQAQLDSIFKTNFFEINDEKIN